MAQLTTHGSEMTTQLMLLEFLTEKHEVMGGRLYAPKEPLSEQEFQNMSQLFPSLLRSQHQGEEVVTFPNS